MNHHWTSWHLPWKWEGSHPMDKFRSKNGKIHRQAFAKVAK